jgi:valyl-tRNA synthetase
MICGFVLAKPGEKISKSKDNAKLSPQELINTYSADAIRYWAANARLGIDTFFDIQEMLDSSKRLLTKLWNSSKFVLSHLGDFDPQYQPRLRMPIDIWIMERTNETIHEVKRYLDEYEIGLARKVVDDLFWKDLCDYYIEIVKDRLYRPEERGDEERKSAQYAIYYCLFSVLKMYAIYIPHETEYIYLKGFKEFDGSPSVHLTQWPKPSSVDRDILAFGETVKQAIFEVRKMKSEQNLSMKTELEQTVFTGDIKYQQWIAETDGDFRACTRVKKVEYNLS